MEIGGVRVSEPTVSIIVINWNGERFLSRCLEAIREQTYPDIELFVIDNASSDGSVDLIKGDFPDVRLVENGANLGFCRAFNQGVRMARGEYVMPLNPDVFMTPTFIVEMVKAAESDRRIGSVTGKLLQNPAGRFDREEIIDSTGLFLDRRRRTYDRGQGEVDRGQYDSLPYVFGACGAAPLYRRAMLENIAIGGEFFDEDFFAYYEDADLAWRAQLLGWRCAYAPGAVAYHVRGSGDTFRKKGHRPKDPAGQIHALKNRYLMLVKNDAFSHLLLDLPWILANEVSRYIYMALFAPQLLRGTIWWVSLFKSAWEKRRVILRRKVVSNAYIRQWFVDPFKASQTLPQVRKPVGGSSGGEHLC